MVKINWALKLQMSNSLFSRTPKDVYEVLEILEQERHQAVKQKLTIPLYACRIPKSPQRFQELFGEREVAHHYLLRDENDAGLPLPNS